MANTEPSAPSTNCLNCGTPLTGQYCGNCGQRARTRLISMWELVRDAFGDLFELDSRLWKTLIPLLIRPGKLTRDYLEGRRARYMPPFRTYLVLSLIFFVVAFFNPREDLSVFFEPEPPPSAEELAQQEAAAAEDRAREEEKRRLALERVKRLNAEGKISDAVVAEIADDDDDFTIRINGEDSNSLFEDCDTVSFQDEDDDFPEWVKERFSDERLKVICERNKARGNDNLVEALLDNIPVALIVLLPMMALVLKILYPLSRRYFVEHLLFFVHFHAFFFLILTLQVLFARFMGLFGREDSVVDSIASLLLVVASLYIPVYLYKAMRHVYGQGHVITLFKYLVLLAAYLTGATITMIGAFLIAVISA